jgi:hypothetical protein
LVYVPGGHSELLRSWYDRWRIDRGTVTDREPVESMETSVDAQSSVHRSPSSDQLDAHTTTGAATTGVLPERTGLRALLVATSSGVSFGDPRNVSLRDFITR